MVSSILFVCLVELIGSFVFVLVEDGHQITADVLSGSDWLVTSAIINIEQRVCRRHTHPSIHQPDRVLDCSALPIGTKSLDFVDHQYHSSYQDTRYQVPHTAHPNSTSHIPHPTHCTIRILCIVRSIITEYCSSVRSAKQPAFRFISFSISRSHR